MVRTASCPVETYEPTVFVNVLSCYETAVLSVLISCDYHILSGFVIVERLLLTKKTCYLLLLLA